MWMAASGVAALVSLVACGGNRTPEASSPSPPVVDPNVAYKQYDEAAKPFECSPTYRDMDDAAGDGNFGIMKDKAFEYRDVVATFGDKLGGIEFPNEAKSIVNRMAELTADEVKSLNELAQHDGTDKDRLDALRNRVWLDDSSLVVEVDHLRAALGHPLHPAAYAADQLDSAQAAFYTDDQPVHAKWTAAMAAKDLAGAKAANAIEIDAIQRYIDQLDAIDWPPGTFEGQANALRDQLRRLIEFDRRQVDVATAEDIIEPASGSVPEVKGMLDAKDKLWTDLVRNYHAAVDVKC
jgi:hypothetical protein